MKIENSSSERHHYIDWVRVLAFLLLIFFHCAMPFVNYGWEIKNKETSAGLTRLIWWMHQWRLPLLFFISGVGIHFSLKKRSVLKFTLERIVRLFIPLLFAMFFTIPLQVYFEWLQEGKISMSYVEFYPSVWQLVPYPKGSLTWSHMWFVVYLFVFCMLLIPFFALFKIPFLKNVKSRITDLLSGPLVLSLLFIPFMLYHFILYLDFPEQGSLMDDWFLFLFSLTLLLFGYILGGSDQFWDTCARYRYYFLGTAIASILYLFPEYWWNLDLPKVSDKRLYIFGFLNSIHIWMIILSILGFAKTHLNFSNNFLKHANQAVYPFYILHQTLIVSFGFYITQWDMPIFVKMIILILLSFLSLVILYRYLIKPYKLFRVLYGVKLKKQAD
ncbi:MAG: acyltransferase family protein [Chitinophagaceae bacterium]